MCLSRFVVTSALRAWRPVDRDHPELHISIAPGARDLFTDGMEHSSTFIKFIQSGSWYEAERSDFVRSTARELAAHSGS